MPEEASPDAPEIPAQMNAEQAFQIIQQACAAFQGNLHAHQQIQTALQVLAPLVVPTNGQAPNRAARRHPAKT